MFAGPNGSGKSTIKSVVPAKLLGVYLNPDEIQKDIEDRGFLNVRDYGVETTRNEILEFFVDSTQGGAAGMRQHAARTKKSSGPAWPPLQTISRSPARQSGAPGVMGQSISMRRMPRWLSA